jgi:hypothetical protein
MVTVLRCRRTTNDVTAGGHLAVDSELAVSAESDADAGNCSASDSGRGLSYEAVSDDAGMRSQARGRTRRPHHDTKLRAHAAAVGIATGDQLDPQVGKQVLARAHARRTEVPRRGRVAY